MNALMDSQIFFFISSVGFVILGLLAAVILIVGIRIVSTFLRITAKIEQDIHDLGDTSREMLDDLRDSMLFRLLFKRRRNGR
jgi:hypothetical protein